MYFSLQARFSYYFHQFLKFLLSFIGPKSRSYYDQFLTDAEVAHYRPKPKIEEKIESDHSTPSSDDGQDLNESECSDGEKPYNAISTLLGNSKVNQI